MRVCIVSRELAPFVGGGIGTFAGHYARAFADAGHQVHLLTQPHPQLQERAAQLWPSVSVHEVELDEGPAALDAFGCYPQRYAVAVAHTLKALHAKEPFGYIEFPDFWGEGAYALCEQRLLGELAGAVTAVRLHTPSREVRAINATAWLTAEDACIDMLEDQALSQCDLVLSPTHSLLEMVKRRLEFHQTTAVVPNLFYPPSVAPGPLPHNRRVLYFGRLEHRKGVDLLVKAALELWSRGVELELSLIGADTNTGPFGGSMQAHLSSLVPAKWAHRLNVAPACSQAELRTAMQQARVCCFPSRWENFPNVCLEAMAQGAVVVGSDAGGMAEIIEEGHSGLLFRAGDVSSLAQVLERALSDDALAQQLHEQAPHRIATLCDPKTVVDTVIGAAERVRARPKLKSRRAGKRPEVSVLVPLYNLGATLPQTLESLSKQTFDSLEVIVVDDGSTDAHTIKLLDGSGLDAPGLSVLRQTHAGVSAARNRALQAAKGKWVLPLDPDDLIAPHFIETMVGVLTADPRLTYATSFCSFFTDTPDEPTGGWAPWGLCRDVLPVMNVASSCSALTARAHLLDIGGWDESLPAYEDWDVFCSLAERGRLGAVVPQFLFYYRVRPDSLMRTVVEERHYRLWSQLLEKHPHLSTDSTRTARLMASQTAKLDHAPSGIAEPAPLRHRVVDDLNEFVKQVPLLHPLLKGAAAVAKPGGLKATAERVRKKLQRG